MSLAKLIILNHRDNFVYQILSCITIFGQDRKRYVRMVTLYGSMCLKLKYRRKGDKEWREIEPRVIDGQGNQYTVEHSLNGLEDGSYEAILVARNSFGWSQPSAPHTFMRGKNIRR